MPAKGNTNCFLIRRNSILHSLRYKIFKLHDCILEECLYGLPLLSFLSRLFLLCFVFLTPSYSLLCGRSGLAVAYRCAARTFKGRIEGERDGRIMNAASMPSSGCSATKQLR